MFWFVLISMLLIVFVSVVFGLSKSRNTGRRLTNHQKMTMAKASGGLPGRKEN